MQLEPVHARHRYIHNDNFCLIDFVSIQTLTTARKCHSVVTMRLHEASQCPSYRGFIVNNTDKFRWTSHRQRLTGIAEIKYRTLVLRPGAQQRKMLGTVDGSCHFLLCSGNSSELLIALGQVRNSPEMSVQPGRTRSLAWQRFESSGNKQSYGYTQKF